MTVNTIDISDEDLDEMREEVMGMLVTIFNVIDKRIGYEISEDVDGFIHALSSEVSTVESQFSCRSQALANLYVKLQELVTQITNLKRG